ncbi:MAG: hypothetical protein H0W46_04130, partial [Acidimicrobiia bacterium]|nr:hypothetical protein [Acidimicrobiia bacterium]
MNVRPEDARSARRPPQRAVSQRRYLVRRVVALVIVSVLIVGLVKGVGALFGGGGGDETLDAADPAGAATPTSGAEAEEPAPSTAGGVAP